jgi:hypothetical protein
MATMRRPVSTLCALFFSATTIFAQSNPPLESQISQSLARQQALARAKDRLAHGKSNEAIQILEENLSHVDGHAGFLQLLRTSYQAELDRLQLDPKAASTRRDIEAKLKQLETSATTSKPAATIDESPAIKAPLLQPVIKEKEETINPASKSSPLQQPLPQLKSIKAEETSRDHLATAMAAFQQGDFATASHEFLQANQANIHLDDEQKKLWGYCKLHEVANELNAKTLKRSINVLEQEARMGISLGGSKLDAFGNEVLARIEHRRKNSSPETSSVWQMHQSTNFKIFHQNQPEAAAEAGNLAETARIAMFERWSGPIEHTWTPACDLYLHPTSECYSSTTKQAGNCPSHSTVQIRDGKVHSRRIDLQCQEKDWFDSALPREVTYVVLSEIFADEAMPKWAETAMTTLAESPTQVARYLRSISKVRDSNSLIPVAKLLQMQSIPVSGATTAFYAESISLVDFLVKLKGAKSFTVFLREVPRRGYEVCLQRYYGIKNAQELQDRWLQSIQAP